MKPWDKIRTPAKTPIGEGQFRTTGGLEVEVRSIRRDRARLRIGARVNKTIFPRVVSMRELAEFLTELADQVEGK